MCDEATVLVREVLMRSRCRIQGLLTAAAAALLLTMTGLVISATSAAAASGYWLGGDDGGVFSFNAPYNGNLLIGGEFSTDGNSVCAQGCSIGSGSSTDNYVLVVDCRSESRRLQVTRFPRAWPHFSSMEPGAPGGYRSAQFPPPRLRRLFRPIAPGAVSGVAGDKGGRGGF